MRTFLKRATSVLTGISVVAASSFLMLFCVATPSTYADSEIEKVSTDSHYVTIFDQNNKLSVKSDAVSVAELLERANVQVGKYDIVEPGVETIIDSDNFKVNIYRARPVIVIDGTMKKYVMSAGHDPKAVAETAGITVYDGDEVQMVEDTSFLEAGATTTYKITRNGGRTVTVREAIPFTEEIVQDPELEKGQQKVNQVGEDGEKVLVYQVNFVDNKEVSRELVSDTVVKEPVKKIIAEGTKVPATANNEAAVAALPSVAPGQETCAQWVREAGVSDADITAALYLIYHESGCRVNASNPSGAYGIPQALPGSKMASEGADWQTNPVTQIRWMAKYVRKYGGWQGAYNFWVSHHWY